MGDIAKEFEESFVHKDIYKQFLDKRVIFLWGEVNDRSSEEIVKKLIYLSSKGKEEIKFYLNSPGGSVTAGMAIYDAMQSIPCDISVTCTGLAASMGALLLCAGTHGKRYGFPHCRVMIHQPLIGGHIVAPASDIKIQAEEMNRTKSELNHILAKHTGKSFEVVQRDTDRDNFMSAEEAKSYGLIDQVITKFDF